MNRRHRVVAAPAAASGEDPQLGLVDAPARLPRLARGGIGAWALLRLALGIGVVLSVTLVIFLATHALGTDAAQAILGRNAQPEALAQLRHDLGLDAAWYTQYWDWLSHALRGDLGSSLKSGQSVTSLLGSRLVNSLFLLAAASLIALPLALFLGASTALRRDGWLDRSVFGISLGVTALPEFVVGLLLVIVFSTGVLHVLPAVALIPPGASPLSHPKEMILPVATLVIVVVPYLYRQVRGSMIDVLESDYIAMSRLKGMPESLIIRRDALPNALIPMIQASALTLSYLLGGIVVVEYLFGYPGIGGLLVDAITNRDFPVIEGTVLVIATGTVLFNFIADLLTVVATPKLRTAFADRSAAPRSRRGGTR